MPWVYTISCVGSNGKPKNLNYQMTASDYATAATDAATILAAFQAVSAANVAKTRLSYVTEYPVSLPSGVDTAIVATLSGKILSTQKPVVVSWPAPKDALRLGTEGDEYNELDLSDTDVEAYWDLFNSGAECTISDGEHTAVSPRASQIISKSSRNP